MALQTVEGIYKDGRIELNESPSPVTGEARRVLVTFLPFGSPDAQEESVERARQAAGERLIARMRAGIDFGGERFSREELYAERLDSIARRDR